MVSGANPDMHQAWYKEEDVYNALESVPSAQPEHMTNRQWIDFLCCVNYERCGYPASKTSKEACKEMWRSFFKGADTPEKMANRMYRAADCDTCPVAGMCGNIMCGCETAIIAWLMNENLLYSMAMERS